MSLAQLERLVKPPDSPIDADLNALAAAQDHLGVEFPKDYVALCALYGTGCFGDPTFYFDIYNVLRPEYKRKIDNSLELHRHLHAEFPDEYDLEIFPQPNAYLPCGANVDGGAMGYVVSEEGPWKIATRSRDCTRFELWDLPLTSFLFHALTRDIRPKMWRPDFPEDSTNITFVPGPYYHQSVGYRRPKPA
jgi:hypothetical protein